MLIGVVAVALLAVHAKLMLYPLLVAIGVDHVIVLHVAFISAAFTELHV